MSDGAKAILIAPDWRTDPFFKPMWEIVQRCYYYKPGIKFFELDDREVPPLRKWGVWAVLVKGTEKEPAVKSVEEVRVTKSSKRRKRRGLAAEARQAKKKGPEGNAQAPGGCPDVDE